MATIKKKLSLKIAELFPGFVGSDQAGVITFLEKYYEFLESAELKLTSVSTVDRLLQEEGSTNFVIYNNEKTYVEIGDNVQINCDSIKIGEFGKIGNNVKINCKSFLAYQMNQL